MPAEIHVDDIGTSFRFTIKNQNEQIVDLSDAISMEIVFITPDGVTITKNATFVTDGEDGQIEYIAQSGDLNIAGIWRVQAVIELMGGRWYSDIHSFKVHRNI